MREENKILSLSLLLNQTGDMKIPAKCHIVNIVNLFLLILFHF